MITEYQRKWVKENRDKVLAQKKRYRETHKVIKEGKCIDCGAKLEGLKLKRCPDCKKIEQKRAYDSWVERNAELLAKKRADWFKKNKKRVLKQQKAYRESLR